MKTKKRKKSTRFRGTHTHGRGGKKKARGSGHRGGFGMAGTGKRGDQRKTLILNMPEKYFGKSKTLRRKVVPKLRVVNVGEISENIQSYVKKGSAKETGKNEFEIILKGYKILSLGEVTQKLKIHASAASESAIGKVKKAGGDIFLGNTKEN